MLEKELVKKINDYHIYKDLKLFYLYRELSLEEQKNKNILYKSHEVIDNYEIISSSKTIGYLFEIIMAFDTIGKNKEERIN